MRFTQISGREYGDMMAPFLGQALASAIGAGYDRMPPGPNPLLTPDTTPAREVLGVTFTPLEQWARLLPWRDAAGR